MEVLLTTGGSLRIKGLTESRQDQGVEDAGEEGSSPNIKVEGRKHSVSCVQAEEQYPLVTEDYDPQLECDGASAQVDHLTPHYTLHPQSSPLNASRFLASPASYPVSSPASYPVSSPAAPWPEPGPKRLGHQRALVKSNNQNEAELNR